MGRARRKYKKKAQFDWQSGAMEMNTLRTTLMKIGAEENNIKVQRLAKAIGRLQAIIGYGHFNKIIKDE